MTCVRRRKARGVAVGLASYGCLTRLTLARRRRISRRLVFFAEEVLEFGLVFGLAAGARGVGQDAGGLGLADTLAGVGLDGLGGRESGWLAFGHAGTSMA